MTMDFRFNSIHFKFILVAIMMLLVGCSDNNNTGVVFKQDVTLQAEDAGEYVNLTQLSSSIKEISGGAEWLTATKHEYAVPQTAILLTATDNVKINAKTESRRAIITIVCENGDRVQLVVTQEGSEGKSGADYYNDEETDMPAYVRER